MRAVGLFEGVGQISHAASMLGYDDHIMCEKESFQRSILAKRYPHATLTDDVLELRGADLGHVDLMHGGSPCQGISVAGLGRALLDERSKLIMEFLRLIGEAQPRIAFIENVAVLRSRGLHVVVNELARMGYGCWWDCIPALAVGAPHLRDRVWITAVHYDEMPDLLGKPMRMATTKLPRAGASTMRGYLIMEPQATIKMAKDAMGAKRQPDGTTWLTKLDSPLFPTPSAVSYGTNQGGAAGRSGQVRHSLESMARNGVFPDQGRMWPTPHGFRKDEYARPQGPSGNELGNAVNKDMRQWPTPSQRDYKDMALGDGAIGRGQLPEAVPNSLREDPRMWPTPSAAVGSGGPGRSEFRSGGPNLRTAVDESLRVWPTPRASANEMRTRANAPSHGNGHGSTLAGADGSSEVEDGRELVPSSGNAGPLNPSWVEILQGMPMGLTNPDDEREAHELQLIHGATSYLVGTEVMCSVHGTIRATEIRERAGRCGILPTAEVLLACVLGRLFAQGRSESFGVSEACAGLEEELLRSVWRDAGVGDSPYRPGLVEQRSRERTNPLQVLSRLLALDAEAIGIGCSWQDAFSSWPATWELGIPRVLADVPYRKERLMSIGNACLWQVAYLRIKQAHEMLGIDAAKMAA